MIGRFISADTIIPNPANPQSFNRYSYCLNNPLKYVDPSGHCGQCKDEDSPLYIIVGGSGTTKESMQNQFAAIVKALHVDPSNIVYLPDIDPENFMDLDIYSLDQRVSQIERALDEHDHSSYVLIGHSEGGAAIGAYLNELANSDYQNSRAKRIKQAIMIDAPLNQIGTTPLFSDHRFQYISLINLPDRLESSGYEIQIADIWNESSFVHGGNLWGWSDVSHSYSSVPGWLKWVCMPAHTIGTIYGYFGVSHEHPLYADFTLAIIGEMVN